MADNSPAAGAESSCADRRSPPAARVYLPHMAAAGNVRRARRGGRARGGGIGDSTTGDKSGGGARAAGEWLAAAAATPSGRFERPSAATMAIYSLYLISKSGSLLYQRDFKTANSPITKQKSNDYLIIASNLHGIHTIASKLTPAAARGSLPGSQGTSVPVPSSAGASAHPRRDSRDTSQLERAENRSSTASVPAEDEGLGFSRRNTGGVNGSSSNGGINVHSNKTGLRCVSTEKFNMFVHQTVSGLKIIILTSTDLAEYQIASFQTAIHRLYADYVMKNPFYSLDMPIRIKLFDDRIMSAVINYNIK